MTATWENDDDISWTVDTAQAPRIHTAVDVRADAVPIALMAVKVRPFHLNSSAQITFHLTLGLSDDVRLSRQMSFPFLSSILMDHHAMSMRDWLSMALILSAIVYSAYHATPPPNSQCTPALYVYSLCSRYIHPRGLWQLLMPGHASQLPLDVVSRICFFHSPGLSLLLIFWLQIIRISAYLLCVFWADAGRSICFALIRCSEKDDEQHGSILSNTCIVRASIQARVSGYSILPRG